MTNEPHTWCTMIYVADSRDVAGLRKGATIRLTAPAYWKFESIPLQQRVCELSVPVWARPARGKVRKVEHHAALPTPNCPPSWPSFADGEGSPLARWSLPS
jgi:hypothetical protein